MEISYDKSVDALYIGLRKGVFAKNKKIGEFIILDVDAKGNLLGIEVLEASKRIPAKSLSEVHIKNLAVA